jgi:GxxExxY protein
LSREGREESEDILNSNHTSLNEEQVGKVILDSAFKVHTTLGPGLLESVYEAALAIELTKRGLLVERQKPISIRYEGQMLEVAFRADVIVNHLVLVELKSVETVLPLFEKTTMNYLKLIPLRLGFLINFNETHLKNGITRITNGLEGKSFFNQSQDISKIDLKKPSLSSRPSSDI